MRYSYRIKDNSYDKNNFEILMNELGHIYDDLSPEYVFVFGGDGTVLSAVDCYKNIIEQVTFIGINFGKLGFYTDFSKEELNDILELINSKEYDICSLPLLEYHVKGENYEETGLSLNEISLISGEKTLIMDIYINDELFEKFRGTGIAVSTPSGSTAYNKSLGGAVVDISLKSIQLTEIASINNRVFTTLGSPIILGEQATLKMVSSSSKGYIFTQDNHHVHIENSICIETKVSNKKVNLLTHKNHSFFKRVQKAFIGDLND